MASVKKYYRADSKFFCMACHAAHATKEKAEQCYDGCQGSVVGPEPQATKICCDCGAKHTSFPDHHSDWCTLARNKAS